MRGSGRIESLRRAGLRVDGYNAVRMAQSGFLHNGDDWFMVCLTPVVNDFRWKGKRKFGQTRMPPNIKISSQSKAIIAILEEDPATPLRLDSTLVQSRSPCIAFETYWEKLWWKQKSDIKGTANMSKSSVQMTII